MPVRAILLLIFFIASLPVCLVLPFYGIVLWTIVAFLNPQSFLWGAANVFPWAQSVAIATMIGFPIFSRGWKNFASGKVFLIVILWSWFTITSVISTSTPAFFHHSVDTWAKWQFVSKVLLMTVITVAIVDSFERLRTLVIVIGSCFAVFILKAIPFIALSGGAGKLYGPERSMIADNNDFGLALNMTLPLFFFLAQMETRRWLKNVFGALFVLTIPTIFFTYSRGAMVGLIAVLGLMMLRLKRRIMLVPVLIIAVLVAVVFAPEGWRDRMDPNKAIDASARERFNAWTFSWNLVQDYPLTGGGFGTFTPELFRKYAPVATDIRGPHSVYFGVVAEHGFPGLALYLFLVLCCFRTAHRLIKRARLYDDHIVASYAEMFRLMLVGFLTSGMFLGRAYFDYYFTIVACLIILERLAAERWAAWSEEDEEDVEEEPDGLESADLMPANRTL